MNLALPALLIILGILPGIVFFHSYFSGKFPRKLSGISGVSEVALYVIFTIPLGVLAIWVAGAFGQEVNYDLLAKLLVGNPPPQTGTQLSEFFRANGTSSALIYLLTLGGALVLGNLSRRFVWAFRLDVRVPFLRLKHEWFYTLSGRLVRLPRSVVPSVDVLVKNPDGSQLYQGILTHLEVGKDGQLEQLILNYARRGKGRGADFKWVVIPGDRFIVTGHCIHSINMLYLDLSIAPPPGRWPRFKNCVRKYWRSFYRQEP